MSFSRDNQKILRGTFNLDHPIDRAFHRDNSLSMVNILVKMLKIVRPLNIQQIRSFIEKTKKVATLIRDQEIVLLLSTSEVEKSIIIQLLKGTKTDIAISYSLSKSKIQRVIPMTIQSREIILYDALDISNSDIPEINIVNAVGTIEALKNSKCIKILALPSCN